MGARRLDLARMALSVFCVCGLTLVFGVASALAVAPEAPEALPATGVAPATGVGVATAMLNGVLNPNASGETGTYEFLYRASASECAGGEKTPTGLALGLERESVSAMLAGLQPHTAYTVCLLARNLAGETALSPPRSFVTPSPAETPETKSASGETTSTATLNGALNPGAAGEPGTYEFRYNVYNASGACEVEAGRSAPVPAGAGLGNKGEAVSAGITGLLPGTRYAFCLLARNSAGEAAVGSSLTFKTLAEAPRISSASSSNVLSDEAALNATIDGGGAPTSYRVEYGLTDAYGSTTPEVSIGSPSGGIPVRVRLGELESGAEYHFRFVATNALGEGESADATFSTPVSSGPSVSALPDNRAFELVSSPSDNADVYDPDITEGVGSEDISTENALRASVDGNSVVYAGEPPVEGGNGKIGSGLGDDFLAKRGASGWSATSIEAPGTTANGGYQYFSPDLSVELLESEFPIASASPYVPEICITLLYSRSTTGVYSPLFTSTQTPGSCGASVVAGASADGSHILFESNDLLPEANSTEVPGTYEQKHNLYDLVNGQLHLVNVMPDGSPESEPNATFGAPVEGSEAENQQAGLNNFVSADGSRVFWSSLENLPGSAGPRFPGEDIQRPKALYVRKNDSQPQSPIVEGKCTVPADACTVQIDATQGGSGSSGGGRFWTASSDGSRVYFTDCKQLTADSTAVPTGGCAYSENSEVVQQGQDLYEYDVDTGRLTDLTVDSNPDDSLGADVQGVIGVNETGEAGSYVYFVAGGALAPGATSRICLSSEEKEEEENERLGLLPAHHGCNLYVLHDGKIKFIAGLLAEDNSNLRKMVNNKTKRYGDWVEDLGGREAEVSSEGRSLVFRSARHLTGYDSGASQGRSNNEVFVYDAVSEKVFCASCDPSGRPAAFPSGGLPELDGAALQVSFKDTYTLRWISADGGRVFFDTTQALAPQDTNGRLDVYEWERNGVGSCAVAGIGEVERGCVYLLSGGSGADSSYFVDSDATGDNVFFASRGQLTPQAHDENIALYDARVNGGFPELSLSCTGTGCQGVPPAAPIFATPSSVTFSGVGNFPPPSPPAVKSRSKPKQCKQGFVKRHGRCVKRKAAKAKRSTKRSTKSAKQGGKR
jgi:hypothetical protein